jgi:hypothetical protein
MPTQKVARHGFGRRPTCNFVRRKSVCGYPVIHVRAPSGAVIAHLGVLSLLLNFKNRLQHQHRIETPSIQYLSLR